MARLPPSRVSDSSCGFIFSIRTSRTSSSKEALEQLGLAPDLIVEHQNAKKLPAETLPLRLSGRGVRDGSATSETSSVTSSSSGLDGSTLIALTADHGEYLGEHGLIRPQANSTTKCWLYRY